MARRKKTYAGERFTVKRTVKLTPAQAAEIDAAAEQQGATWSDFARELMFRRLGMPAMSASTRRDPAADRIIQAMRAAALEHASNGNNLNQIARHLNSTGDLRNWADLREAVALFARAENLYIAALEKVLTP
jgi:Bacterial mobilisation protein (MobC)